mmetsp:Transcript_64634/g.140735  ORF Transcript_64634/g.140735 Transcript_64634/m.140735 type:complete len:674 (+) Transcript_64634:107-2128(+)
MTRRDSPRVGPALKRLRSDRDLPLPLLALADRSAYDAMEGNSGALAGYGSMEPHGDNGNGPSSSSSGGDWRMVLYHDQNVILYNPRGKPPFRSKRVSTEENPSTELSQSFGRCPLCRQKLDSRFACAAQAYFDLLQGLHRSKSSEPSEEADLITEDDLYSILAVPRSARLDDIKRAYRKLSLRYHPDKNLHDPLAKVKFQKIAEAFSVLADETKRSKYDKSGDMDLDGFDMEQFMNMVNASGAKFQKTGEDYDGSEGLADGSGAVSDAPDELLPAPRLLATESGNPFLLAEQVPVEAAVASDGGAEAEASAAASLRHLPPELLNTGYYARFFVETQELGSGSFGSVFLCRHVLDDLTLGDYAVKKVPVGDNKAWLRDMIREVKTFERLHHANIVEYKHSWLELSRRSPFCPFVPFLFILMQYCDGGSLDELLWQDGNPTRPKPSLPVALIWRLLFDILRGLQHLHRQGILHRDLKPTNILLQRLDGENHAGVKAAATGSQQTSRPLGAGFLRAMLSDFGTAAPLGEPAESAAGVAARGYTGTVEFTAPELLRGDSHEYSEKSDMWSLGIVLYAMCFSSLPFSHDDPGELKKIIRRFVEERRSGASVDATAWLPQDSTGRLGSLPLVAAALLAFDPARRPAATDLLENPVFRAEATRHARTTGDMSDHAALPDF